MKRIVTLCSILIATSAWSQSRSQLLREIRDLSLQIERETFNTRAGDRDLQQTSIFMRRALNQLTGSSNPGGVFNDCRDFIFPELKRVMPTADALDEAINLCRNVAALPELKWIFSKINRVLSTREAITIAANYSDIRLLQKLDLLQFIFSKYNRVRPTTDSMDRAVMGVQALSNRRGGDDLRCVQENFAIYSRTMPIEEAMNRTIKSCL